MDGLGPEVEVGQRYESIGVYRRRVWEVQEVYLASHNVAHARLRDVRDSVTQCTLAPEALLDRTRFKALGRHQVAPPSRYASRSQSRHRST